MATILSPSPRARDLARRVEKPWLRYAVTLLSLSAVAIVPTSGTMQLIMRGTFAFSGLLMAIYFFGTVRKMGCSAVEGVSTFVLFTVITWLLWTVPGAGVWRWILTPFVAAWLAYGLATGIARAEIFGFHSAVLRLASIVIAWVGIAGWGMLPVLAFGIHFFGTLGADYRALGVTLLWASGAAVLLDLCVAVVAAGKAWPGSRRKPEMSLDGGELL